MTLEEKIKFVAMGVMTIGGCWLVAHLNIWKILGAF